MTPIDSESSSSIISLFSTSSPCSIRLNVVVLDSGSYPTAEARDVAVNVPATDFPSSPASVSSAHISNVYEMCPVIIRE